MEVQGKCVATYKDTRREAGNKNNIVELIPDEIKTQQGLAINK